MTKSELKQKLEAVRDSEKYSLLQWPKQDDEYEGTHVAEGEYPSHYRDSVRKAFEAGRDTLLPLLLDAYEALESASFQLDDDSPLTAQDILSDSIARIEAFANGEK